jgi:hypothetical protein
LGGSFNCAYPIWHQLTHPAIALSVKMMTSAATDLATIGSNLSAAHAAAAAPVVSGVTLSNSADGHGRSACHHQGRQV